MIVVVRCQATPRRSPVEPELMEKITPEELAELKEAINNVNKTLEHCELAGLYGIERETNQIYLDQKRDLAHVCAKLVDRGVTELDLEDAVAVAANPLYRRPAELGFCGIDDMDGINLS